MSDEEDRPAKGLRMLLVEDEAIVSLMVEDMLYDLGSAEVWHAASLTAAEGLLRDRTPDAAVLDVNLSGQTVYALAERLRSAGVPFLFASGYGREGVEPAWAEHVVLQKPFRQAALAQALRALLSGRG